MRSCHERPAGRSVVTDGPFVEIGADRDRDGDFDDPDDLTVGDDTSGPSAAGLPIAVRWASSLLVFPVCPPCSDTRRAVRRA